MTNPAAAIQGVTNFLRDLLRRQLKVAGVPTPDVTLLPPGNALPNINGANLYLYRVVESPSTKNQDWRGNRTRPPTPRPVLGLQLSYLVTPLAPLPDASGDVAHFSLGVAMLTLHENPILNDVHLPGDAGNSIIPVDADVLLPESVRESYEQVKVTLLPTSVDEISRIWATLNQPYRLSVAYEVSLVELLPTLPSPRRGGIVLETNVDVTTMSPPTVRELDPLRGPLLVRTAGELQPKQLRINGSGLIFDLKKHDVPLLEHRQMPTVRVGGQVVEIDVKDPQLSSQSLLVTMPDDLDAGPQIDVRVTLQGRSSVPATFSVNPWLTSSLPIRTSLELPIPKLTLKGMGFSAALGTRILFIGPAEKPVEKSSPIDLDGTDIEVKATIPDSLENGLYDVRLENADGSVTNKRSLEVLPQVIATTQVQTPSGPVLNVVGKRLTGTDFRMVLDGAAYVVKPTSGFTIPADPLVIPLTRKLADGSHMLTLSVDGHQTRPFKFEVP